MSFMMLTVRTSLKMSGIAAVVAGLFGAERDAIAQIQPLSEVRTLRVTGEVGLQRQELSDVAPLFVLWEPQLIASIRTQLGDAVAFAQGGSSVDADRIQINWTAQSVAEDRLLDALATTHHRWVLRFRLTTAAQLRVVSGAISAAGGASSASSLLRLTREGGGLIMEDASDQSGPQIVDTILPMGEYLMEAETRTASLNNPSPTVAGLNSSLIFTPIGLQQVGSFRWRSASGGNGHVYQAWLSTTGPIDWDSSGRFAEFMGGTLATPTTEAENLAVFNTIASNPALWTPGGTPSGPWLGGAQLNGSNEPLAGWIWLTGETLSYENWWVSQPDNNANANRMAYFGAFNLIRPLWGDYVANDPAVKSFIVELPASYCPADFDGGGFVDDSDFVIFSAAYDAFACAAGPGCEGDFTSDGFVDDADFVIFTQAYDAFACP